MYDLRDIVPDDTALRVALNVGLTASGRLLHADGTPMADVDVGLRHVDSGAPAISRTDADGNFTVVEAECLAGCGFPTCVQINSQYFENVGVKDVPKILDHLKGQAPSGGGSDEAKTSDSAEEGE